MSLLTWFSLNAICLPSGETRGAKRLMDVIPATGDTFPARSTHAREEGCGGSNDPGAYINVPLPAMLNWATPVQLTPTLPYKACITPSSACTGVPDIDSV